MSHTSSGQIRWKETLWSDIKAFIASTIKIEDTLRKIVGLYMTTLSS